MTAVDKWSQESIINKKLLVFSISSESVEKWISLDWFFKMEFSLMKNLWWTSVMVYKCSKLHVFLHTFVKNGINCVYLNWISLRLDRLYFVSIYGDSLVQLVVIRGGWKRHFLEIWSFIIVAGMAIITYIR